MHAVEVQEKYRWNEQGYCIYHDFLIDEENLRFSGEGKVKFLHKQGRSNVEIQLPAGIKELDKSSVDVKLMEIDGNATWGELRSKHVEIQNDVRKYEKDKYKNYNITRFHVAMMYQIQYLKFHEKPSIKPILIRKVG